MSTQASTDLRSKVLAAIEKAPAPTRKQVATRTVIIALSAVVVPFLVWYFWSPFLSWYYGTPADKFVVWGGIRMGGIPFPVKAGYYGPDNQPVVRPLPLFLATALGAVT